GNRRIREIQTVLVVYPLFIFLCTTESNSFPPFHTLHTKKNNTPSRVILPSIKIRKNSFGLNCPFGGIHWVLLFSASKLINFAIKLRRWGPSSESPCICNF